MSKKPKKLICKNLEQAQTFIKQLGIIHCAISRLENDMSAEVAGITQQYAEKINPLRQDCEQLSEAIELWCAKNKDKLLTNGKKTAKLTTGEVSWRVRPPSVVVKNVDEVVARLERFGLHRLIRVKKELNKEAVLSEPSAISGIDGVSIKTGSEDIIIKPFLTK